MEDKGLVGPGGGDLVLKKPEHFASEEGGIVLQPDQKVFKSVEEGGARVAVAGDDYVSTRDDAPAKESRESPAGHGVLKDEDAVGPGGFGGVEDETDSLGTEVQWREGEVSALCGRSRERGDDSSLVGLQPEVV
jgi:hypothetical protein